MLGPLFSYCANLVDCVLDVALNFAWANDFFVHPNTSHGNDRIGDEEVDVFGEEFSHLFHTFQFARPLVELSIKYLATFRLQ